METVDRGEIARAAARLGLAGRPICAHTALSSFGHVQDRGRAVLGGLLDAGVTVLVPTFADLHVPAVTRPPRNGWDYDHPPVEPAGVAEAYTPATNAVARRMGALARTVLDDPDRVRGGHALCSFAAIGPSAEALVSRQSPREPLAPLEALAELDGAVVLMGVGLERATILHLAEQHAGRRLFRRWANGHDGQPMELLVGGCSRGFPALEPAVAGLVRTAEVGESRWRILPPRAVTAAAAAAIRSDPAVTHCGDPSCLRCDDAVAGGPLVDGPHGATLEVGADA